MTSQLTVKGVRLAPSGGQRISTLRVRDSQGGHPRELSQLRLVLHAPAVTQSETPGEEKHWTAHTTPWSGHAGVLAAVARGVVASDDQTWLLGCICVESRSPVTLHHGLSCCVIPSRAHGGPRCFGTRHLQAAITPQHLHSPALPASRHPRSPIVPSCQREYP